MHCNRKNLVFLSSVTALAAALLVTTLLNLWNALVTSEPVTIAEAVSAHPYSSALCFAIFLPIAKVSNSLNTVTGRYSYIGNPCTTKPCLPGMAYAVLANDKYYYITIDGRWLSENRSWSGYTPEPDDLVTITGYVLEKKDVFGKPFRTIEVVSLQPAK